MFGPEREEVKSGYRNFIVRDFVILVFDVA
jgi:hypothetical protein